LIWIWNADTHPDAGGQKLPTKIEKTKSEEISCLEVLDVLF
jgi:hypothetical protein